MNSSRVFKDLKELFYSFIDGNGNIRTLPIGQFSKRKISSKKIKILKNLIVLCKDTDLFSSETKLYLSNRFISIRGVNEEWSMSIGKKVNLNTTASKIGYDRKKVIEMLGDDIVTKILLSSDESEQLADCERKIIAAYIKYGNNDESKHITSEIALDLSSKSFNTEITDDDFNEFLGTIEPYTKISMRKVAEGIDEKILGYLNYILYGPSISSLDKQRRKRIIQLIEGDTLVIKPEEKQLDIE